MRVLTKRKENILWAVVNNHKFYPSAIKDKSLIAEIDFLIKNEFIENYVNTFRLLPDGVIYLSIETNFSDIKKWTSLVETRISNRSGSFIFASREETDEYFKIITNIAYVKAVKDFEESKKSVYKRSKNENRNKK